MPTYTYETIPADSATEPRRFDLVQRMTDERLQTDPQTGDPVRRIISGGQGIRRKVLKRSTVVNKSSAAATACGCATGKPHQSRRKKSGHSCGHSH
jgi:predicted nucleic acid-binding Zn ribbon protein